MFKIDFKILERPMIYAVNFELFVSHWFSASFRQMEMFKNEISRLKCEKLDLARQNVVSKMNIHIVIMILSDIFSSCGNVCYPPTKSYIIQFKS